MRQVSIVFFVWVCFFASSTFAQEPFTVADQARETAKTHFRLQEYDLALEKYKEAYRLSLDPEMLFNIGLCYERLGNYQEAMQSYQNFLFEAPKEHPDRKLVEDLILTLETKIDGTFKEESSQPVGTPNPLLEETKLPEKNSSSKFPLRPVLLGGAGAGVALSLVFGGLALSSTQKIKQLTEISAGDEVNVIAVEQELGRRKTFSTLSTVFFLTSVVSGSSFFLLPKSKESARATVSFLPFGINVSVRY